VKGLLTQQPFLNPKNEQKHPGDKSVKSEKKHPGDKSVNGG